MESGFPRECFPTYKICIGENAEPLTEFGSFENVNAVLVKDRIQFEFQKSNPFENEFRLSARYPTFPFLPPNSDKLADKSHLNTDCQELLSKYYNKLATLKSVVKTKCDAKAFYTKLLKKFDTSKSNEFEVPPALKDLVEIKQKIDKFSDSYKQISCEWLNFGGCLSYCKHPQNEECGFLLKASGNRLSTLNVFPVGPSANSSDSLFSVYPYLEGQEKVRIKRPINQIHSTVCGSHVCCIVRTKCKSVLLQLGSDEHFKIIDTCQAENLTSTYASPYLSGEYVFAVTTGDIYTRHAETQMSNLVFKGAEKLPSAFENWWHCYYSAHPLHLMIACRTGLVRKDLRDPSSESNLFILPNEYVYSKEYIYQSFLHPRNLFQHFIATTNQLILLDERFTQAPLLSFNHCLSSVPLFNATTLNVFENNQDVVLLAGKHWQEVMCFHLGLTSMNAPYSLTPPWCLSSISDFFQKQISINNLQKRLMTSIKGMCSVPHKKYGFTGLYISSYGDVFGQSYRPADLPINKTCEESLSSFSVFDDTNIETFSLDWINDFKENIKLNSTSEDLCLEEPNNMKNDRLKKSQNFNIQELLNNIQKPVFRHSDCSLCSKTIKVGNPHGMPYCKSCDMTVYKSKELTSALEKDRVINMKENEFSLHLVNLQEHWDPMSQSLLKYWQIENQSNNEAVKEEFITQTVDEHVSSKSNISSPQDLSSSYCVPESQEAVVPENFNKNSSLPSADDVFRPKITLRTRKMLAPIKRKIVLGF